MYQESFNQKKKRIDFSLWLSVDFGNIFLTFTLNDPYSYQIFRESIKKNFTFDYFFLIIVKRLTATVRRLSKNVERIVFRLCKSNKFEWIGYVFVLFISLSFVWRPSSFWFFSSETKIHKSTNISDCAPKINVLHDTSTTMRPFAIVRCSMLTREIKTFSEMIFFLISFEKQTTAK